MRRTALLFAAVVLAASLLPAGPPDAGGIPVNTLLHLVAYAALGWLLAREHPVLVAVLVASAFGCTVEGVQALVPWRTASVVDAATNLGGATIGAILCRN